MSSDNGGWIKLHRKITNNWIWEDPEKLRAWLDILLMVNHENRQIPYNGHIITIKAGQKLTSLAKLSERWGWSRNRVDRFLRLLSEAEMVTANRTPNGTVLTVVNWAFFQDARDSDEATVGAANEATVGATVGAQTRMNKNVKNVQEERAQPSRFQPPTFEAVSEYFAQIGCGSDPQLFIDYYAARGWRLSRGADMADWKAAARSWKKRSKEKEKERSNNRFDNFPERDYSSGDLEELGQMLNAKPI